MGSKKRSIIKIFNYYKYLYIAIIPAIIYFIIFHYAPIYGLIIAFEDYHPMLGFFKSPWVGLKHFYKLFGSYYFTRILSNTLIISMQKIIFGFFAPLIFALLLNELRFRPLKRFTQTVSYLPHFISWVVIAGLLTTLLSPAGGVINKIVLIFRENQIHFLADDGFFRPIIISSYLWKELGWASIIYLAAISGVNPELYEVAIIDGASRWRCVWSITIPSIANICVIVFILSLAGIMSAGFEQILLLYSPSVYNVGDIIDTYVYREGILNMGYSFATAVGLFKSFISLLLVLVANKVAKALGYTGLW